MPANSTHSQYQEFLPDWSQARAVLAGGEAVKMATTRFLPRLEAQTDSKYAAYVKRASFFNATGRTADGYVGQIFRRAPFIRLPEANSALGRALKVFNHDADMLGSSLRSYARNVVSEVVAVGRAGTLIDWEGEQENGCMRRSTRRNKF